jgi:outer membrane lipoprotein LolB
MFLARLGIKIVWIFMLALTGCSSLPVKEEGKYSVAERKPMYEIDRWSFEGRLSVRTKKDSWQANIGWVHGFGGDELKLSGPLGQGVIKLRLTKDLVILERGGGKIISSNNFEDFINHQMGMFVPVQSFRYWVVGLPEPSSQFIEIIDGFKQAGWLVEFGQMQRVSNYMMPRKVTVTNEHVKLKLMIDQWDLNDTRIK